MRAVVPIASLALMLVTAGCVSKSRHDMIAAELAECRTDKVAAQEASQFCERRYAKEIERWDSIQAVVEEALPETIREFESERDRIVAQLPEQMRQEVDDYLSQFAGAVARGFDALSQQNQKILTELAVARTSLSELGVRSKAIDDAVSDQLRQALSERHEASKSVAEAASALVEEIQEFDRTYVGDRASGERLRLNRRERETITLFHNQLVAKLIELRDAGAGS